MSAVVDDGKSDDAGHRGLNRLQFPRRDSMLLPMVCMLCKNGVASTVADGRTCSCLCDTWAVPARSAHIAVDARSIRRGISRSRKGIGIGS